MAGVGGNSGGFKRGGCQASDRGIFLTRDHDIRTSITAGFHRVCHSSFQQRPRSGFLSLSLLHREYTPSLLLMWADRNHINLHKADRARQEVRQRKCTVHPVNFQNKTPLPTPQHSRVGNIKDKHTQHRRITYNFTKAYSTTAEVQTSTKNDEINTVSNIKQAKLKLLKHSRWDTKLCGGRNKTAVQVTKDMPSGIEG